LRIDTDRRTELLAAMDHTMTDAGNLTCVGQYDVVDQSWKQVGMALVSRAKLPGFLSGYPEPGCLAPADGLNQA
jgi:hypothetical protein